MSAPTERVSKVHTTWGRSLLRYFYRGGKVRGGRIARIESASMESCIFVSIFELPWDGV